MSFRKRLTDESMDDYRERRDVFKKALKIKLLTGRWPRILEPVSEESPAGNLETTIDKEENHD